MAAPAHPLDAFNAEGDGVVESDSACTVVCDCDSDAETATDGEDRAEGVAPWVCEASGGCETLAVCGPEDAESSAAVALGVCVGVALGLALTDRDCVDVKLALKDCCEADCVHDKEGLAGPVSDCEALGVIVALGDCEMLPDCVSVKLGV